MLAILNFFVSSNGDQEVKFKARMVKSVRFKVITALVMNIVVSCNVAGDNNVWWIGV
jgi:hypothetical protein